MDGATRRRQTKNKREDDVVVVEFENTEVRSQEEWMECGVGEARFEDSLEKYSESDMSHLSSPSSSYVGDFDQISLSLVAASSCPVDPGHDWAENSLGGTLESAGMRFTRSLPSTSSSLHLISVAEIDANSAADWSGVIEIGDVLVSVDGCPAHQAPLSDDELIGPEGSLVSLIFERDIGLPQVCSLFSLSLSFCLVCITSVTHT